MKTLFFSLIFVLVAIQAGSSNSIVDNNIIGSWSSIATEMAGLGTVKNIDERVEFFSNGKYLWINNYTSKPVVQEGAYDYQNGNLTCYLTNERKPMLQGDNRYYFTGKVVFMSSNTIKIINPSMKIIYERRK